MLRTKTRHILCASIAAIQGLSVCAATQTTQLPTLADIAGRLAECGPLSGHIEYEVYIPSSPDPVNYDIKVTSIPVSGDSLCKSSYIVDWTLRHDNNSSTGFSAYFDGNHYRYRNQRLTEYHACADPAPFLLPEGKNVQTSAQFVNLLPAMTAGLFATMATDSTYIYNIKPSGKGNLRIEGVRRIKGFDALEYEYVVDAASGLPVSLDMVYNPASISEQTASAKFKWLTSETTTINEAALVALYPEVFEKYRTDNFQVANLPGTILPTITAPTATRERYCHNRGEDFRAPTLLIFLDPEAGDARGTVVKARNAAAQLPMPADIIYLFSVSDANKAENVVGQLREGEHLLIAARSIFRDLGVTGTPTFVFCKADNGKISDVQIGDSDDLTTILAQKLLMAGAK